MICLNVARWTPEEMQKKLAALNDSIEKDHELAYHFTSEETMALILDGSQDHHGLRASTGGQLGGGVSVCKTPPHEMGWEQWGGGDWRETLGKKLWGEKWQEVLPGGPHADKLEMVIVVKVLDVIFNNDKYVHITFTRQLASLSRPPRPTFGMCACWRVHGTWHMAHGRWHVAHAHAICTCTCHNRGHVMACVTTCVLTLTHLLAYLITVLVVLTYGHVFVRVRFTVPGREDILIIPESFLEPRDGFHYYGLVRT